MLEQLHSALAEAPFASDGWSTALEELGRQTRSSYAQLIGVGGAAAIAFNYISSPCGLDVSAFIDDFAAIDGGNPEVNWRVAATRGQFELVWERDYAALRRARDYSVYDDFVSTHRMPLGCQTLLSNDGAGFLGMALLRSERDGPTSVGDCSVFAAAAPSVLRAVRMQRAMNHQGAHLIAGALDAMDSTTFVLDDSGTVVAMTPAAEREAQRQHLVRVGQARLRALDRAADRTLQQGIARHLGTVPTRKAQRFWIRAADGEGAVCEIYPLPPQAWSFGAAPRMMVSLRTPPPPPADAARLLVEAFGLSPSEAAVALMIAAGVSRGDIAQQRGVQPATVNAQLKTLFRKLDVRREVELAVAVTRLVGG